MESHNKIKKIVWTVFCSISTFLLTGTIWIRRTYGVLALAMVSESFRGGLKNKRILFVKYVMVPTLVVFLVSLIVNRWLKGSHRRSLTYVMGGLMAVSIGAAVIGLDVGAYISRQYGLSRQHWYDSDDLVMHALGSIDGIPNTNSREALENSYQQGNRLLECDMIMTSDWELVACHDWVFWNRNTEVEKPSGGGQNEIYIPTLEVFMEHKFLGKYTPLSFADLALFLKEHPDAYVITDTKYVEPEEIKVGFQELVDVIRENDCEEVLDRFIVQIYRGYMHGLIEQIYPFDNYIFTLYKEKYDGGEEKMEEYAKFCMLYGVDVITMEAKYYHDELLDICNRYGLRLFVHTVNDPEEIAAFREKGVGVYTDNVER